MREKKRSFEYRVFYVRRSEGESKHRNFYTLQEANEFIAKLQQNPDIADIQRMKLT